MDILDETVGCENWQKEYYEVKGNVYCRIGIKTDDGWVWKSDCGVESNVDAEKGEASDAAKRAGFCWGIGRELYSTPKIKLKQLPDSYYFNDKLTMQFAVKEIEYDGKKISKLVIVDRWGHNVFNWVKDDTEFGREQPKSVAEMYHPVPEKTNEEILVEFCRDMKAKGVNMEAFYRKYHPKMADWKGQLQIERLWNYFNNAA